MIELPYQQAFAADRVEGLQQLVEKQTLGGKRPLPDAHTGHRFGEHLAQDIIDERPYAHTYCPPGPALGGHVSEYRILGGERLVT